MLDGANATVNAAQQGLADARVLQESAEALKGRGLGTEVEVDLARGATAQAQYDLSQIYRTSRSAAEPPSLSSMTRALPKTSPVLAHRVI